MKNQRGARVFLTGLLAASVAFSYALATTEQEEGGGSSAGVLGQVLPLDFLTANDLGYVIMGTKLVRKFEGVGGVKPYTFHYHTTNLPVGLTLSAAGYLVGSLNPGALPAVYMFTVTITDSAGTVPNAHSEDFTITVLQNAPISPCIAFVDLTGQLNAVSLPRYPPLPAALQFPAYTIPVRASDWNGDGQITVAEGAIPLGQAYQGKLEGVGGEPIYDFSNGFYYRWSMTGALPSGLNLNENGTVFGVAYKASETRTFLPTMSDKNGTLNGNPVPAPGISLLTGNTSLIGNSLTVVSSKANFDYSWIGRDSMALRAYVNGNSASAKGDLTGNTLTFLWGGASFGPFTVDDHAMVKESTANGAFYAALTPYAGRASIRIKRSNLKNLVLDPSGKSYDGTQGDADDPDVAVQLMVSGGAGMGGTTVVQYDYTKRQTRGRLAYKAAKAGKAQGGMFQIISARTKDGIEETSGKAGSRFSIRFLALGLGDARVSLAAGTNVTVNLMSASYTLPSASFTTTAQGCSLTVPTINIKSLRIGNNGIGRIVTEVIASDATGLPQAQTQAAMSRIKVGLGIILTMADGTGFAGEAGTDLFARGRAYVMRRQR